jgi:hypothetical protein
MSSRSILTQHLAEPAIFDRLPPSVRSFLFESERRVIEHVYACCDQGTSPVITANASSVWPSSPKPTCSGSAGTCPS